MTNKYTTSHEVAYYECDINGNMTLPALIAAAIKVSEEQSDSLNRGSDFVNSFGLTWILTSYQLEITRLPQAGEKISISTQAMEYNKYFCYRHFWIEQGEELVKIEAVFALMDIENRKMASVPEEIIAPFGSEKVKKIRRYPKIEKIGAGQSLPYRVRFYDIDSNHHVNNAVYFNWIIDVLGKDFLTEYVPTYGNIRYDKEVEYGNQIDSYFEILPVEKTGLSQGCGIETTTPGEIVTRHEIRLGTDLCCEATLKWQKIK